ncbi:hypothetical protein LCGC14_0826960, partial [marine sediment metagenome]
MVLETPSLEELRRRRQALVDQEVPPIEPPSPRAQALTDKIRGKPELLPEAPLVAPEFPEPEDTPEALLQRIYPDVEGLTVEEFNQVIDADPEAFLDDLILRGRTEDTDILLEALGLDEQAIHNLFRFGDIPDTGQPHFFSEEIDGQFMRRQGTLTPNGIVSQDGVQKGVVNFQTGEFKSIKQIRREMIPSAEETRRILREGQVPEDEIEKIIAQSKLDLTSEDWLEEYKKINPSFRKDFTYATLGRSIAAGLGDVLQAGGGLAGWADQEKWRDNLLDAGEVLQSTAPPMVPYTSLGETIGNPQFWMTTAPRTTTLSVVAMVPILLGAAVGAPIAGAVGLGATGTALLTLLFGATAGALPEAALESGGAWNEAKRLGMSDEEADKAAGSVYWKNAALLFGANAIGFGLPFVKVPGSLIPRMMSKGLVKPIIVGGKLVGTSLTEGGQEFYQDIITRTALGQEVKWDDEAKMAVLLGTILGGVTGGGLVVFDTIMSRTKAQFTPEQQTVFNEQKQLQLDDGAIDAAAELRAMDFMVENFEDVKTNLESNTEQVNQEEAAKLIVPEDRAEDLALEHVISQEEFGVTEVIPEAPLTEALITDAESIVTQAEAVQPDSPIVQDMRRLVDEAKTLTGEPLREALINIEAIEEEVKGIAGITEEVTPEGELADLGKQRKTLLTRERRGEDVSDEILKVDERIAELRGEPSVVGRVEAPPPVKPPPPAEGEAPAPEGASKRVFDRIAIEPAEPNVIQKIQRGYHTFQVQMIDDLYALKKTTEIATKGGVDLSIEENPYIEARLLKGITGKVNTFLEQGTFGKKFWKTVKGKAVPNYTGESLESILREVRKPEDWQDFSTYMVSRRVVELNARDITTGVDINDANNAIVQQEAKHRNFPELAKRLNKYQDALLIYANEMGLLSKDLLTKLRKNADYVPFYRVFNDLQARGFMGKKMADIANPVKRIKGSEREIINPLESIVKNTYVMISAADRNNVGIMLANLADTNPEIAEVFEKVKTPISKVAQTSAKELGVEIEGMTEADMEQVVDIFRPSFFVPGDEVTVIVDGKKQFYKVDTDLRDALLNMTREDLGLMGKILSAPAKWLRAGAILSPDFSV